MESLGYVECNGLSGAIVAADRMLKTADVKLSSIQNTKGNGWVTLQISGELSAVSVAVQAVKDYLPKVYVTSTVIGRPATGLDTLGTTDLLKPVPPKDGNKHEPSEPTEVIQPDNVVESDTPAEQTTDAEKAAGSEELPQSSETKDEVTCNLCGDPNCPRKLGEPHKKCIHYSELKKK